MARRGPLVRLQTDMFAAGEDLPLLSGATYGPREPLAFAPRDVVSQPALFDLRPRLGADPSFDPIPQEEIEP